MNLNIEEIRQELHDARKRDSTLADWAMKYGARLCDDVEYMRECMDKLNESGALDVHCKWLEEKVRDLPNKLGLTGT